MKRLPSSANSASSAHASENVGNAAATSTAGLPSDSIFVASGVSGSSVAGGSPSRFA
jgi:hypothetical protein